MSEQTTCKSCEQETDPYILGIHEGYCDDCILWTMEPEWVKEHYPEAYEDMYPDADADEDEEARPAKRAKARR